MRVRCFLVWLFLVVVAPVGAIASAGDGIPAASPPVIAQRAGGDDCYCARRETKTDCKDVCLERFCDDDGNCECVQHIEECTETEKCVNWQCDDSDSVGGPRG